MTSDLWALAATLILAMIQIGLQSVLTLKQLGSEWVLSARDESRVVTGISGRFVRAHRNLLEIFPQFVAALFIVHAAPGWFTFPPMLSARSACVQSAGRPVKSELSSFLLICLFSWLIKSEFII